MRPPASCLSPCLVTISALLAVGPSLAAEVPRDIQAAHDRDFRREMSRIRDEISATGAGAGGQTFTSGAQAGEDRARQQWAADDAEREQRRQQRAVWAAELKAHEEEQRLAAAEEARKEPIRAALRARLKAERDAALQVLATQPPGSEQADRAVRLLDHQANKEYELDAKVPFARLLIEGRFLPADPERGRELLLSAVTPTTFKFKTTTAAMRPLAECYELGIGGPMDEPTARAWYVAAIACAAPESALAMRALAQMDETGRGAKADPQAAIAWYRQAAALGDEPSRARLAELDGDRPARAAAPGEADLSEAEIVELNVADCLATMAAADPVEARIAARRLATMHLRREVPQPDRAEALRLLRLSAEAGDEEAADMLAVQLEERGDGAGGDPDPQAALPWLQRAAVLGNLWAVGKLGAYHYHGKAGLAKDPARAVPYLRAAAGGGVPGADYLLGEMHRLGEGGLPIDLAIACEHYRADRDPAGLLRAGTMLMIGDGVPRDVDAGIDVLASIDPDQDPQGQWLIGQHFERQGMPDAAYEHYRQAAAHGHAQAGERVAELQMILGKEAEGTQPVEGQSQPGE